MLYLEPLSHVYLTMAIATESSAPNWNILLIFQYLLVGPKHYDGQFVFPNASPKVVLLS